MDQVGEGALINSRHDIKGLIEGFQEFRSMEAFFRFVAKVQEKGQFELRVSEFKGYKGIQNTIEVFCPQRPNCKFSICYRYVLSFSDADLQMHELIVFDKMSHLSHFHSERIEGLNLGKRYMKGAEKLLL